MLSHGDDDNAVMGNFLSVNLFGFQVGLLSSNTAQSKYKILRACYVTKNGVFSQVSHARRVIRQV